MNKGGKFLRLPAEEKTVLLEALVLLPVARLGLRALGLRRMKDALALGRRCSLEGSILGDAEIARARRVARLVDVAAGFIGGNCLARSMVLAKILGGKGIPAQLRIGVRSGERGIDAHAWVEAGGTVLNDGQDVSERFAAFDRDFVLARGNGR